MKRAITLAEFRGERSSGVIGSFFAVLACAFLAVEIAAVVAGVLTGGSP